MHADDDHGSTPSEADLAAFWEERYSGAEQVWSGRPNPTLVELVSDLPVGRALDLGCGEGGDVIWLAQHGWQVTGIDISPTALARGAAAADRAGIPADRIQWQAHDLSTWTGEGTYDLVAASFLHSPIEIPRSEILRRAAAVVGPAGHLAVVSHAAMPPWSQHRHDDHHFPAPEEELESLGLPAAEWRTRVAETRSRPATGPNGEQAILDDVVVMVQRKP
jgi:SAM-dependent methyltransferase